MLEVRAVSKSYGKKEAKFKALDSVTFSVPEGSIIAIIGKSGSGKSTLMHAMSGLDTVDDEVSCSRDGFYFSVIFD